MSTRPLLIFGNGGLAREVAYLARSTRPAEGGERWGEIGYVVQEREMVGRAFGRHAALVCDADVASLARRAAFSIGVGVPAVVRSIADRYADLGLEWPVLVHENATGDWPAITIGPGSRICAGVSLTSDIVVGRHTLLNLNCTVGHDARIGDHCVVNPGVSISGSVEIGDGCLVGTGAVILQGLRIGAGATVGAGAVVVKDVPPGAVVAGVPAKPLRTTRGTHP